ncbi:conserved membrane hypothetical protein [Thermococcus barophilus]|uniref:Uncharacterized protein n=1 Tax=Thermococcus barophilus TaxID=55802 RepID=A0A0S1XAZ0_THEBA|nr:conserved membrane hypothetical protein [Thermococcus barophilus]
MGVIETLDAEQVLSLGIVIFSLLLTGASLIAYKKTRLRKFLIVSLAFSLYAAKEFVEQIDIIFPEIEGGTLDLLVKFIEFIIIALFFVAVALKERRRIE